MSESIRLPREPTSNQIEAAAHLLPDLPPARARRTLTQIYETFIAMRPDSTGPSGLTKKMAQLLDVVREYIEEHGHPPTQRELAAMFQCDRQTIRRRLHAIRRRGYIQIKPGYRGIIILKND